MGMGIKISSLVLIVFIYIGLGNAQGNIIFNGDFLEARTGNHEEEFRQYLGKIWIIDCDEEENYHYPYSFFITSIENGELKGEFQVGMRITPSNYSEDTENIHSLSGSINGDIAECYFQDRYGNSGFIVLKFIDFNRIDIGIEYLNEPIKHDNNVFLDERYSFRPYNILDYKNFVASSLSVDFSIRSYGEEVNIVAGIIEGNKPYPAICLTNDKGDILYEFGAPYQVSSEVKEILVEDLNGDGLQDVKITTYFSDIPEAYNFEWFFYQNEYGLYRLEYSFPDV